MVGVKKIESVAERIGLASFIVAMWSIAIITACTFPSTRPEMIIEISAGVFCFAAASGMSAVTVLLGMTVIGKN